ncbi:MAG: ABC transporter substrate-binding protein, partial [Thermoplasmata archaeon]
IVYASDPIDYAAASMWASNLTEMDPNIHATPIYQAFSTTIGYMVPGQNPMPIYLLGWSPDYPYPSDYVNAMYLENGTYPAANGWNYTNLVSWGYIQEAQEWKNMTDLILKADSTANLTLAIKYFDQAEQIAVNLTLYVYTYQANGFWFYAPWIHGVEYEENPMIGGGGDTLYFYLTKG